MKASVKWGLLLGVALCVWTMVIHLLGFYTTNLAAGKKADVIVSILPVIAISMAVAARSRAPGASFGQLFLAGFLVGVVSLPISMSFMWLYHHYINPLWLEHLISFETERLTAAGADRARIDTTISVLRASGSDKAQIIGPIVGTLILSTLLSAIAAAVATLFRRVRPKAPAIDPV